jgi:outer membrane protein OmpA-like peptidoglycan-associated protein
MQEAWRRAFALAVIIFGVVSAEAQTGEVGHPPAPGMAPSPLLQIKSLSSLRGEVESRYQRALTATLSPEIIRAEDTRFIWASETKVACGIATGFLKSRTIDAESITKCDAFSQHLDAALSVPATAAVPPPLLQPAAVPSSEPCRVSLPVSIFFDWNIDTPPPETREVVTAVVSQMQNCGWARLGLIGHADRSGGDAFNEALSRRRAANAALMFENAGVPTAALVIEGRGEAEPALATADGIREPKNRRVEILNYRNAE